MNLWEFDKGARPIFIRHAFVDIAGDDLVAGAMLDRLVFWFNPMKEGGPSVRVKHEGKMWVAKKSEDWHDEIRISPKQAARAADALEARGLIEVRVFKFAGAPTKHYRLHVGVIEQALNAGSSISTKGTNPFPPKGKLDSPLSVKSITKSTTESTTDIEPSGTFQAPQPTDLTAFKTKSNPNSNGKGHVKGHVKGNPDTNVNTQVNTLTPTPAGFTPSPVAQPPSPVVGKIATVAWAIKHWEQVCKDKHGIAPKLTKKQCGQMRNIFNRAMAADGADADSADTVIRCALNNWSLFTGVVILEKKVSGPTKPDVAFLLGNLGVALPWSHKLRADMQPKPVSVPKAAPVVVQAPAAPPKMTPQELKDYLDAKRAARKAAKQAVAHAA